MVDAETFSGALSGRTILITGASSGLGEHFAKSLAKRGASVGLAARRVERLEALKAEIEADGGRCAAAALDVEQPDAIGPAFDAIEAELGPIHGLVNNAGMNREGAALSVRPEDFAAVFNVNVTGAFFCAQEAARRLIARGPETAREGRIVNISSITALKASPGLAAYAASKAALISLTKTLAREWARHGIAVNAICPGYIATDINADWLASEGGQKLVQGFARRRLLNAEDLDAPLALLLGPESAYVTGSIITIDDGQTL
jgi:NAD(P)-dependent dehydrogenase (short-subunit alcohol dehydrogenase family)